VLSASLSDTGTLANLDAILQDSGRRSRHVQQVVSFVEQNNAGGVAVAYEDLPSDQRISFGLFVQELADALHTRGKSLLVELPAPQRVPDGIDEGAYDWAGIAAAADVIALAPIRDQSTYRQDLPVILEYLRTRMDLTKLVLTVTPYAAEKSQDGIRTWKLTEAMTKATKLSVASGELATNENVDIVAFNLDRSEGLSGLLWDTNTATVAFTYKDDGGRTVWLENFFSIGFKLEFVPTYGLGGVAIEDASDDQFLGNIWTALVPYLRTGQPILMRPNPADLEPRWSASDGTLEGGQSGVVRWTAPAVPGSYTVNLVLSDGVFLFDSEIKLNVKERDEGATTSGGG
jgi:spore germination protein YaaH